jgi:hypothetical protein
MQVTETITIGDHQLGVGEPIIFSNTEAKACADLMTTMILDYALWRAPEATSLSNCLMLEQGFPSLIIAAEFVSTQPTASDLIGIRLDSRGLGVTHALGVSVMESVAREMKSHRGIRGVSTFASDRLSPLLQADHCLSVSALAEQGIEVVRIKDLSSAPSDLPVWVNGEPCDLQSFLEKEDQAGQLGTLAAKQMRGALERSVLWPFESKNRSYLLRVNGTLLSSFVSMTELDRRFPAGFVIDRIYGMSHPIRCVPEPERHDTDTWFENRRHALNRLTSGESASYLVQELREVSTIKVRGRKRREHLIMYFVASRAGILPVGGYAASVRSGVPRLCPDAIVRAVHTLQ